MKLETIRNRPYYLKTGPSELAEFRLEYVDKFRDGYGYVHVFKFKDINCRKIVVKPIFSVSLQYSMKMMLEVDDRPVRKEEICIDNHNELYLMIYLQNFLSDVEMQTLKMVSDRLYIKYTDNIESTGGKLTELAKTKIMAKFFSEKTEDMDVEKLMLFKQLNEGRFDPAEIMQYRMMSSVYLDLDRVEGNKLFFSKRYEERD